MTTVIYSIITQYVVDDDEQMVPHSSLDSHGHSIQYTWCSLSILHPVALDDAFVGRRGTLCRLRLFSSPHST